MIKIIQSLLGAEADDLLKHKCKGFPKESLYLPGPDFIDRVWVMSDRSPGVLRSLASLFGRGHLVGAGCNSIGLIMQSVGNSVNPFFSINPLCFMQGSNVKLTIEGESNAVASFIGSIAQNTAYPSETKKSNKIKAQHEPKNDLNFIIGIVSIVLAVMMTVAGIMAICLHFKDKLF